MRFSALTQMENYLSGRLRLQCRWAELRIEFKIFLATFSLAFVALFIIHLVALPFYWANASPQLVRPFDLYLPNVWTPAIILYSILIAVFVIVSFYLGSLLRKGKANEATIFIITFCLGGIGFWLFAAFLSLRWGHTMRLPLSLGQNPKSEFLWYIASLFSSFVSAVFSTAVFVFYKLVRWTRKRLKPKA